MAGSHAPSATSGSRRRSTEARSRRLLGLGLQGLARRLLSGEASAARVAALLRRALRRGRDQLDLLPAADRGRGQRVGRADAEVVSLLGEGEPLHHSHQAAQQPGEVRRAIPRLGQAADDARKLDAILWQLPPSFKRNDERLDAALTAIRDRAPGRHVVELRHPSWFTKDVYELLGSHKAALAIVDDPKYPFAERQLTTSWTYVRMHRGGRGSGGYTKAELATWKRRIAAWRAQGRRATSTSTTPRSHSRSTTRERCAAAPDRRPAARSGRSPRVGPTTRLLVQAM